MVMDLLVGNVNIAEVLNFFILTSVKVTTVFSVLKIKKKNYFKKN